MFSVWPHMATLDRDGLVELFTLVYAFAMLSQVVVFVVAIYMVIWGPKSADEFISRSIGRNVGRSKLPESDLKNRAD